MCSSRLLLLSAATCLLLAGCQVTDHKHGGHENVDIGTPFGSMHVKTNDNAAVAGLGLSLYPGAVPFKDENDHDNDAADVSLNFGDFHLGVKAASFTTTDPPSKVEAFYRKDMARYGDVLKCRGGETIGQPTRTSQGLTCRDNDKKHASFHADSGSSDNPELRTGSPEHQHIVGIEAKGSGTKIGLVALDLPSHHDSGDSE